MFAISRTPQFKAGMVNIWLDELGIVPMSEMVEQMQWTDVEGPYTWGAHGLHNWICYPTRAVEVISVLKSLGLVLGRYQFFRLWNVTPYPYEIEAILSGMEDNPPAQ